MSVREKTFVPPEAPPAPEERTKEPARSRTPGLVLIAVGVSLMLLSGLGQVELSGTEEPSGRSEAGLAASGGAHRGP